MRAKLKICLMLAGICSLHLSALPSTNAQKPSNTTSQTTGGLTGATNTPSAIGGILDKSPMSATIAVPGLSLIDAQKKFIDTQLQRAIPPDRLKKAKENFVTDETKEILKSNAVTLADFIKNKIPGYNQFSQIRRPEGLLYIENQTRIGNGRPFYAPSAMLSSGRIGLDVAVQSFLGEVDGYAFTARKDLLPERQYYTNAAYVYNDFLSASNHLLHLLAKIEDDLRKRDKTTRTEATKVSDIVLPNSKEEKAINDAVQAVANKLFSELEIENRNEEKSLVSQFVTLSKYPQVSFIYSFRSLHHIGNIHTAGVSISRLTPLHDNDRYRTGLTVLLNIEGLYFASDDKAIYGPTRSAVRTGAALVWINHVPYVDHKVDQRGDDAGKIVGGRWTWQAGLEYRFRNIVDGDYLHKGSDLFDGFARYRDLRRGLETTASIGKGTNNHLYVGLSLGVSVLLP